MKQTLTDFRHRLSLIWYPLSKGLSLEVAREARWNFCWLFAYETSVRYCFESVRIEAFAECRTLLLDSYLAIFSAQWNITIFRINPPKCLDSADKF